MPTDAPDTDDDTAPWELSELAPGQRRRRLIVLAVVVVAFVGGAAAWSFGFGRNLSGHIGARVDYDAEVQVQEAAAVVPEGDYRIEVTSCDVDAATGKVEAAGTLTLSPGVRGGSYEVQVAFLDGDEDATIIPGIDEATLLGGGDSAPLDLVGDVLPDTPQVECVPLSVLRRSGTKPIATSTTQAASSPRTPATTGAVQTETTS